MSLHKPDIQFLLILIHNMGVNYRYLVVFNEISILIILGEVTTVHKERIHICNSILRGYDTHCEKSDSERSSKKRETT